MGKIRNYDTFKLILRKGINFIFVCLIRSEMMFCYSSSYIFLYTASMHQSQVKDLVKHLK